jgi:C-terminal domain 7 of the ABC-three component (ABC-3C) systems
MLRREPDRNTGSALEELRKVARDSENASLKTAFSAFSDLSVEQQRTLVDAITVIDGSPDIAGIEGRIREKLRLAVDRQYRDALYERLEGWWLGKVIEQLRSAGPIPVAGFEVYDKVRSIAQQFGPEGLPIDYLDARPESLDAAGDTRMFVRQLRAIDVGIARIEKAMLDFYRAFEQRSRWAREELLIGDEVEAYERRLVDEWERFSLALVEELSPTASEMEQRRVGRQVFNWMEQIADLRIRPSVTEPYVMRGSFHVLADGSAPRVWWHPKFLERVAEILGAERSST